MGWISPIMIGKICRKSKAAATGRSYVSRIGLIGLFASHLLGFAALNANLREGSAMRTRWPVGLFGNAWGERYYFEP
jgi:hypothetical protein